MSYIMHRESHFLLCQSHVCLSSRIIMIELTSCAAFLGCVRSAIRSPKLSSGYTAREYLLVGLDVAHHAGYTSNRPLEMPSGILSASDLSSRRRARGMSR